MRWIERNLLALCLTLVAPCFGQNVSTASINSQDVLASLINSGGYLVSLEFQNQRIQPDVRINGIDVPKYTGGIPGSYIMGTSLVVSSNFCSPTTNVTLYPGNPPSPQNFTGSELCARFLHVEPTRESEENGYSCGYIFGYVFGIPGPLFLILIGLLIACFVFGLCYYWKWLMKKNEVSEEENLKFSEPLNQGNANDGQSNVPDNFGGEEGVDSEQPDAVPNIFDHFLCEVEMILREPREGVLTILSLRQVCRRAGCAACSHNLFDMHIKLGDTEVAINCETCRLKGDFAVAFLENKAKEMISYKEDNCWSKCFQGFLFHHNTIVDSFDLSYLENQIGGKDVSLYKVEMASGTEPHCFKMFKDMLHMLIRQQAASLNDYPVSETDVHKPVAEVTKEDPEKTATLLPNGVIKRNQSSRSMARSDGGELHENTTSQDDTPKIKHTIAGHFVNEPSDPDLKDEDESPISSLREPPP